MRSSASLVLKCVLSAIVLAGVSGCSLYSQNSVTLEYYQIDGKSLAQLDTEIKKKGPRINGSEHAVAVSNIRMIPDITLTGEPTGCRITRARIKVKTIITLPRWNGRRRAERKLARAWDNLDRYTRLHEAVHVTIAHKYAKQLELRLKTLKPDGSCKKMGEIARKIIDKTMRLHEKEQLKFDTTEKARFARLSKLRKAS